MNKIRELLDEHILDFSETDMATITVKKSAEKSFKNP